MFSKKLNKYNKIIGQFFFLFVFLCASSSLFAACKMPEYPDLPDPDEAVLAQMVKAKKEVKVYMGVANVYLKCTRSDSKHDRVVNKMRVLAKDFNKLVSAYKARVKR